MLRNFTRYIAIGSNIKKIFGIWLVLLSGLIVLAAYFDAFEAKRANLELLTTINWLFMATILANALPKGNWSICFIFFIAFGIFHGGLVLANVLGGITDADTLYQISFWFDSVETENAIHLVNLAFLGFCLAALLFSKPIIQQQQQLDLNFNKRLYHIGGAVLVLMTLLFFALATGTGAIYSYGAYLAVVSQIPIVGIMFTYIYVFIGLSLVLLVVTYQKGFNIGYFAVFAIWSLIAFKLGLRGEVMFPSAVAACVAGRKGKPMNGFLLLLIVVAFLIVAGIVKNARISGDYSSGVTLNPMDAVAEMGSSLRAVQEVINWRKNGDELMMGASYWAPFERQFALFIPQLDRIPAEKDGRLLNVTVIKRAGPIGFSPVAEAYINFGEKGVFFVFFMLGTLFAYLDNQQSKVRYDILLGVSLVPIFIMIRNSFAHVPVQIIVGQIVALFFVFLAHRKNEN
jgi:hypothetical protein